MSYCIWTEKVWRDKKCDVGQKCDGTKSVTYGRTDGRTDGRMDRQTTEKWSLSITSAYSRWHKKYSAGGNQAEIKIRSHIYMGPDLGFNIVTVDNIVTDLVSLTFVSMAVTILVAFTPYFGPWPPFVRVRILPKCAEDSFLLSIHIKYRFPELASWFTGMSRRLFTGTV